MQCNCLDFEALSNLDVYTSKWARAPRLMTITKLLCLAVLGISKILKMKQTKQHLWMDRGFCRELGGRPLPLIPHRPSSPAQYIPTKTDQQSPHTFWPKKTTTPFQKHKIIYKINMCHCFPLSQFLGYSVHLHPCVLQGFWVSQNCPWRLDGRPQTERTARSPAAFTASCWTCLSRRFCMPSAVVFPRRPKNSEKASATSRGGKRTSCV